MAVATRSAVVPTGLPTLVRAARAEGLPAARKPAIDIIDIRSAAVEMNIKDEIHALLKPKHGPRKLPTLLLYNQRGLQLFEEITYLEEYYLTNDEIKVLTRSASRIAGRIPAGAMVIELGSGNLRKVNLLLQAFEEAGKQIDYYALDLDRKELERTLAQLPAYRHVRTHGLLGTYDDGRDWLKEPSNMRRQKCVLSLGSSIGNFHRHEASEFLRGFARVLSPGDTMLVGLDSCLDPAKVFHAYNDREGVTHSFILNGLLNANDILGEEAFKIEDWKVIGEYVYDDEGGRHQAFYAPVIDVVVLGETIKAQERIQVEQSLKYSLPAATKLWNTAGLEEADSWMLGQEYGLHMLAKPKMPFSLVPSVYASSALPTLEDWDGLWAAWDTVTRGMISQEELLDKPIKLRNACIFYLGHTPTFLDIQLNKTTKDAPTEPRHYITIFERGIDPDVDNPEHCHAHSIIPDEWPPVEEILEYQERVRERLRAYYRNGAESIPRPIARAIWVSFEHEVMHLETLLYMLVQSEKTLPPPNVVRTDFVDMAQKAKAARVENQWFDIPAQDITIGMDDPEDGTDMSCHFGWDNEKPRRKAKVHAFQAKGRPITNEEYAQYLYATNATHIPASWVEVRPGGQVPNGASHTDSSIGRSNANGHAHTNGLVEDSPSLPSSFLEDKAIRTVYGLVPLKYALDWPIFASYNELAGCASWLGGRIPTFEEARSIYEHVSVLKKDKAEKKLGKTVPAVNGHLSNDGVEETPPSRAANGGADGEESGLFIDLDGANVGFHNWHPVPVTANGNRLCGQGEMGGVWEWTSSTLRKWEGFEPMALYPAYTADFFDEKHNIILGGSWATHPRIAGRKSFVNWYQRNYLYVWSGARLVRDVQ